MVWKYNTDIDCGQWVNHALIKIKTKYFTVISGEITLHKLKW